ncbi:hypothetical protein QCA50_004678 [Cerrena zonata]|uniref:Uncharacterized protein n=1 Tax=Cerrena zonata TaxID=2478898 RepID=A0AAW0GPX0_9APHY
MSSQIVADVERARINITTAFKTVHDLYDAIITIGNNFPAGMKEDVATLQSSLDAILASFKSTQLQESVELTDLAQKAADGFVTENVKILLDENLPLEARKTIIVDDDIPRFDQIIARLDDAANLFGSDFPKQVADHAEAAKSVFKKYSVPQVGVDVESIFNNNVPQGVNIFKTALESFRADASTVSGKLKDLTAKEVDNETFKAGVTEASNLASTLRDTLIQYGKVVQGAASS